MSPAIVLALVLAQNYQGYPVAPRTTGMGGAATALGNGAGNSFYNPSAIAWGTPGFTGDVSGNLFAGSLTALNSQFGEQAQFPRFGFQIIPSNMSFEWRGLNLGPIHLSDRWGLGVSVVAPFDLEVSSLVSTTDQKTLAMLDVTERVYTIYNSIGYRLTDELAFGVSIVAMYRSVNGTGVLDHFEDDGTFENLIVKQSRKSISHGLGAGVQWRPAFGLRAGLSVQLPVTAVFGFGDDHERITISTPGLPQPVHLGIDRDVEARYERPWRVNFGLAWEKEKVFALAVDLSAHAPLEYVSERDAKTGQTLELTKLAPVLNVAVGAEFYVGQVGLRAGFFTDHSPFAPDTASLVSPHINRYGGTFSFNLDRKLYRTELGLLFSVGMLKARTLDVVGGTFGSLPATGTEYRAIVTYSSTLRFF